MKDEYYDVTQRYEKSNGKHKEEKGSWLGWHHERNVNIRRTLQREIATLFGKIINTEIITQE